MPLRLDCKTQKGSGDMKAFVKKTLLTLIIAVMTVCCGAFLYSCNDGVNVTLINEQLESFKVSVKAGEPLPEISVEDKDFEGYWLDANYTQKYEVTVVPDADITLYYKLKAQTYVLVLDFGENGEVALNMRRGYDEKTPSVAPDGTSVGGYSTDKNGEPTIVAGTTVKNLAAKNETVRLYAKYEIKDVSDYVIENGTVTAYTGTKKELKLPYGATKIAAEAFKDNKNVTSIYVPSTYTNIGFGAFSWCDNLEMLTVPFIGASKTEKTFLAYVFGAEKYTDNEYSFAAYTDGSKLFIGDEHFENLVIPDTLTTVRINTEITEISEGAFYCAYSLSNLVLDYPESLEKIGDSAFENCLSLGRFTSINAYVDLEWLSSVKEIGKNAFKAYTGNTESEVEYIYPYSYSETKAYLLKYSYPFTNLVKLPELTNVEKIGEYAFYYCAAIDGVKFGESLKQIDQFAFFYCISLPSLSFPDSLENIGYAAFYACSGVLDVTFGKNISEIGRYAFADCTGLSQVVFTGEEPPILIEQKVFSNGLKQVEGSTTNDYDLVIDGLKIMVPSEYEEEYKSSFYTYVDYLIVAKTPMAPVYWSDGNEITTKFEFTDGGIVYVTDKNQTFMAEIDMWNFGSLKTYGTTCGEYYPMMYQVLTAEEYASLAKKDEKDEVKPLYANQKAIKLWHPDLLDWEGNMLNDLYFLINEIPQEVDGETYLVPMLEKSGVVADYGDKEKVGSYVLSVNKFGQAKVGAVTRIDNGKYSVNWQSDPEGTYYARLDRSVSNVFEMTYYDANFAVIRTDVYIRKNHSGSYYDEAELFKRENEFISFDALTGYNDSNRLYLDGLGGATVKIGDNTYFASVVEDVTREFGEEGYTVTFTNISKNGTLDGELTGKAVFETVTDSGYLIIKVSVGEDSYTFLNVTYNSHWYRTGYEDVKGVEITLPVDSGDISDNDWRYTRFTTVTTGDAFIIYLYAPNGKNAPDYAYFRYYENGATLTDFGTIDGYTGSGEFTVNFSSGAKTVTITDTRGSFKYDDKNFVHYDDSEDMTIVYYIDHGWDIYDYQYTVKTDGYGNMFIHYNPSDDINERYLGTYEDSKSFPSPTATYYELKFTGNLLDKDGNKTDKVKNFWVLYDFASLSAWSDEEGDAQWYGTLASIYDKKTDRRINVVDSLGLKKYELVVDNYGNTQFKAFDYSFDANGNVVYTEVAGGEVAEFVAITYTDSSVAYLIAVDKYGVGLFTVRPSGESRSKFVIVKDKGIIAYTTGTAVYVEIDKDNLTRVSA